MLVDTLQCYFEGKKELFEGLKIMKLEKEWVKYPVVHLDMSNAGKTADSLRSYFDYAFSEYEAEYAIVPRQDATLTVRFLDLLKTACEKTGRQVAVLIDEYDAPLQHSWHEAEHAACTSVYRDVFAVLKSASRYEKFVFLTGITKFTQISLFSVLNNLSNLSFMPEYAAVCGITEEEIHTFFTPEVEAMAAANGWTVGDTFLRLKTYYDGYHFSRLNMVDVYNPYSLINALARKDLMNFWAASGATSMLPKFVDDMELWMKDLEHCSVDKDTLETSDVSGGGAELFLYQSGYLTIKGFDESGYILGFPNEEVQRALYKVVLPALTLRSEAEIQSVQ